MINEWKTQVWFVANPRQDGMAPDFVKAVYDRIFYDFKEATEFCAELNKEIPSYIRPYQVFTALIAVPRNQGTVE